MSSDDTDIERDVHFPVVDEPGVIGLVGPSCEVTVTLEDTSCQALLDTGSMVSTVTYSLAHKLKLDIHPMDHLLRVEGVGGQMLQYLGYVIANVQLPDISQEVEAMFLVAPDIGYNCTTPVLIGSNILQHLHKSESVRLVAVWSWHHPCSIWHLALPGYVLKLRIMGSRQSTFHLRLYFVIFSRMILFLLMAWKLMTMVFHCLSSLTGRTWVYVWQGSRLRLQRNLFRDITLPSPFTI